MSEAIEHEMVCSYLKVNYPDVIFISDASGLKLPIGQATRWSRLKSHKGIPDIIILEPKGKYHGMCIEMKRTGEQIRKKDGFLKTDHLKEQEKILGILQGKRYYSSFCLGFEEARDMIEGYMNHGPASP